MSVQYELIKQWEGPCYGTVRLLKRKEVHHNRKVLPEYLLEKREFDNLGQERWELVYQPVNYEMCDLTNKLFAVIVDAALSGNQPGK